MDNKRATTNVCQRKDGLWEGRYRADGKQRSVYGKTKKEARDKLTQKLAEIESGEFIDETNMTVEQWMMEYINVYVMDVKESTMSGYMTSIRQHIIPALGNIKVKELTPIQVQRFYNSLTAKGLSAKTIRNIHGILHEALDKAVRMELLKKNVTDLCDLPKVRKKEMHPLTSSQLKEFLRRAEQDDPFYAPIFYIAFFTGLREAELIGLTWDCIDFDKHTIRVYRQYVRLDYGPRLGQYDFTSLKNGKERTFQVAPSVIQAFRKLRHRQLEQRMRAGSRFSNSRNFVLTRDDGRPVSASTMYHHYKQITDAMGLPEVRFHDARHTYATLAMQNHVDPKTLSTALGHATVAFTMDVYAHTSDEMQQDMASKMENFISSM